MSGEEVLQQEHAGHDVVQPEGNPEQERVHVRMGGDIAQQVKVWAEKYGLPKAVVSRVSMEVAFFPGGPTLEERLQKMAEERRRAEEKKRATDGRGAVAESQSAAAVLPADLEDTFRKLPEMLANRIDGLKTAMRPLADLPEIRDAVQGLVTALRGGGESAGVLQKIEDIHAIVLEKAQEPETAENASAPAVDLQPVFVQLESLREILERVPEAIATLGNSGSAVAEIDTDEVARRLALPIQNLVENAVAHAVSDAMQRYLAARSENDSAAVDLSPVQSELHELRAQVHLLAQDLQEGLARLPAAGNSGEDERLAGIEVNLERMGEAMDVLIKEAGHSFYLQSNKPIGKLFVGKLLPVKN